MYARPQGRHHRGRSREKKSKPTVTAKHQAARKCKICKKNGHAAFECKTAQEEDDPDPQCWNCGKMGHQEDRCYSPRKGSPLRGEKRVPAGKDVSSSSSSDESDPQCWNCGETGHHEGNCRARRLGSPLRQKKGKPTVERNCSADDERCSKIETPPADPAPHANSPVPPWYCQQIPPRDDCMNDPKSVHWLVDSGCNGHHLTPRRDAFTSLRQTKRKPIKTAAKGGN